MVYGRAVAIAVAAVVSEIVVIVVDVVTVVVVVVIVVYSRSILKRGSSKYPQYLAECTP